MTNLLRKELSFLKFYWDLVDLKTVISILEASYSLKYDEERDVLLYIDKGDDLHAVEEVELYFE